MSDVSEELTITNKFGGTLALSIFQYSDFDLGGNPSGDALTFVNSNTVRQFDTVGGLALSETVVTPTPDHHEGDTFPTTRGRLDDNLITTLNDLPPIGTTITGDVTWAYQWDRSMAENGGFLISKDKGMRPIPEPGTLLLLGAGLFGIGFLRRKKR
jgi:hypothetical protein